MSNSVANAVDFQSAETWTGVASDAVTMNLSGLTVTATGGVLSQFYGASVASPSDDPTKAWTKEIDAYNDTPEGLSLNFEDPQTSVSVTLLQLYQERQFNWAALDAEVATVTIRFEDGTSEVVNITATNALPGGEISFSVNSADYGGREIAGIDLAPSAITPFIPANIDPRFVGSYNATHPFSDFTLKSVSYTTQNECVVITASEDGCVIETVGTPASGALLSDTGSINFTDADLGDSHTISAASVGVTKGTLTATLSDASTGDGAGEVSWTYNVDASQFEYLAAGQTVVESFVVTIDDGNGGETTETIDITIKGTNDKPVINLPGSVVTGTVTERANTCNSSLLDTATGNVAFTDVDLADTHTASVAAVGSTLGTLSLGAVSEASGAGSLGWTYSVADKKLDYLKAGQTKTEVFNVTVNDGKGGTATQAVTVTLVGVNDGPKAVKDELCLNNYDSTGNVYNAVLANDTDPDTGDTKTIVSVDTSNTDGIVIFNAATKKLTYVAAADDYANLAKNKTATDSFEYTMADGAGATSTATVCLTIKGVNNTDTGNNCSEIMVACGPEVMDGKGGNDIMIGSKYDDVLKGGDGCDTLTGGCGDDILYGQKGDDVIFGGEGDDIILGGDGCNILTGGDGCDYFVMSSLTDKDTIVDFQVGKDHLYLADGVTVTNVKQTSILFVPTTVLTLSNGGQVNLLGVKNVTDWHSLL